MPALTDAQKMRILPGEAANDVPCGIAAAVIHKQYTAFRGDLTPGGQIRDFSEKLGRCNGKDFLLVITGDDDIENGRFHIDSFPAEKPSTQFIQQTLL